MRNIERAIKQGVFLATAILLALTAARPLQPAVAETPGIKSFHLYATDGYLTLPDGKMVYVWGYSLTNEPGTAEYPAPTLEVNEGDRVEVALTNIGPKKKGIKRLAHTIHWHGVDTDQQNDGVPHTSPAIQVGESYTYKFSAKHAGTYFYHCHVDTIEHLQMGMFGAFIVKAKNGANQAWTGGPGYDKESVFVLNEIDPVWHKAVEEGKPYDRTAFHPAYWTINGKAYPDTEKDPSTMIQGTVGQTVLLRLVNAGYQPHSLHMHGFHFQVIASDGRPLPQPITKDTILIGPGERYDLLVTFDQDGMFPLHSHNIVDNTNNGVYPGGMHTMMEVQTAPAPDTVTKKVVILKPGAITAAVGGVQIRLPEAPVVHQGATYVPLRFIGEQLGAAVVWNEREQSATYRTAETAVQLWVDRGSAKVNGKVVSIPAAPKRMSGTVMVPLRFVADQLGAAVAVDKTAGTVTVTAVVSGKPLAEGGSAGAHDGHAGHGAGDGGAPADGAEAAPLTVQITSSAYLPQKLTIKKGQTVTWVNKDAQIHTVIDLGDAFASKNLLQNGTFAHTFTETGTYTYYCSTHPSMQAEITVTE